MDDPMVQQALAYLRGHTKGDLRFNEHLRPIKYVIHPDGRPAAPVMAAMLETADTVLYLPEYREGAMEVQVTLEPFKEHRPGGEITDRWRIYHGEPQDIYWAWLLVDAARYAGHVIDGEALVRANPLAADEAQFCRAMNQQQRDNLRLLCRHFAHLNVEDPVMVGIDPMGLNIRGRFDVIRVRAREHFTSVNHAQEVIAAMIESAKGAES